MLINKPFGAVHFIFCLSGKSGWLKGHDVCRLVQLRP